MNDNAVATSKRDGSVQVLVANPGKAAQDYQLVVTGLEKGCYRLTAYYVDENHNNCLTDPALTTLEATEIRSVQSEGELAHEIAMQGESFCLFMLAKERVLPTKTM